MISALPQAEALIDAIAVALREWNQSEGGIGRKLDKKYASAAARIALDVVLDARAEVPCETCGGKGLVDPGPPFGPLSTVVRSCPACGGSGTAQGPRLIVELLMKQSGWRKAEYPPPDVIPKPDGDGWVPVFVERQEAG